MGIALPIVASGGIRTNHDCLAEALVSQKISLPPLRMAAAMTVPWEPASRQEQGRRTESKLLRQLKMRQHPRSGAGSIKHDGSGEKDIIEIKDALKSFSLKEVDLRQAFELAARQSKTMMWLIKFPDGIAVVTYHKKGDWIAD
jgi:hypothetical protein